MSFLFIRILIFYHIHDLQVFSSILWVAFYPIDNVLDKQFQILMIIKSPIDHFFFCCL